MLFLQIFPGITCESHEWRTVLSPCKHLQSVWTWPFNCPCGWFTSSAKWLLKSYDVINKIRNLFSFHRIWFVNLIEVSCMWYFQIVLIYYITFWIINISNLLVHEIFMYDLLHQSYFNRQNIHIQYCPFLNIFWYIDFEIIWIIPLSRY